MRIHVSPQSGEPIYRQIVAQIKYLVAAGRLAHGDELPPIRTLAADLLVNPNTVARAYRELEVEGLLTKRQGAGTYVSGNGSPLAHRERMRILRERADALLADARNLGVDMDEVLDLLRERGDAMERGNDGGNGDA